MKQKSSFKTTGPDKGLVPRILKKSTFIFKPWLKFKNLMIRHPKVAVTLMLSAVIINVVMMLAFSGDFTSISYSFSEVRSKVTSSGDQSDMGIPFSFENYRTMKAIQDTLSWLAEKEHRTAADTAVLLRLIDKIERLDPLFFEKIKKVTHGKDTARAAN